MKKHLQRFFTLLFFLFNVSFVWSQTYISHSELLSRTGHTSYKIPPVSEVVNGELHIAVMANRAGLPTTNGSVFSGGSTDVYYSRYDIATNQLLSAAYIGGSANEYPRKILVQNNDVYILGITGSTNYPVTNGSVHGNPGGPQLDIFLTRINKNTANITMSTYLRSGFESIFSIGTWNAMQVVGNDVHLLIQTNVNPSQGAITATPGGIAYAADAQKQNSLYLRINSNTGNILTASYMNDIHGYYAGANNEFLFVSGNRVHIITGAEKRGIDPFQTTDGSIVPRGIGVGYRILDRVTGAILNSTAFGSDAGVGVDDGLTYIKQAYLRDGKIYIIGLTSGANFPVTTGAVQNAAGYFYDVFYTVLSATNGSIQMSTLYGGEQTENNPVSLFDNSGNLYIGFQTASSGLPTTDGSSLGSDMYLLKANANTGAVLASRYLPGSSADELKALQVVCGELHVLAMTRGSGFPITDGGSHPAAPYERAGYLRLNATSLGTKYGTIFGSKATGVNEVATKLYVSEDDANIIGYTRYPNFPVTSPVPVSMTSNDENTFWTQLKFSPEEFTSLTDTVGPATQNVCSFGFVRNIQAGEVFVPGDSLPKIYRAGVPSTQNQISALYQWQSSASVSGPWTNIDGAITKNYMPNPIGTNKYFRRVAYIQGCTDIDTVSISGTASVLVTGPLAPTASGGTLQNTCPASSVTIGGSPTVSGGSAPYAYKWFAGSDTTTVISTVSNPVVTPGLSTIYTVYVTDANNCTSISQSEVFVHKADAGPDLYACGTDSTRIQSKPIQGLTGVSYSWSPATGLGCTTCFAPNGHPASSTNYIYTVTVPKNVGTCTTSDTMRLNVVPALPADFAGPDKVTCFNSGYVQIGTARQFFPVTIQAVTQSSSTGTGSVAGTVGTLTDNTYTTGARTFNAIGEWVKFDLGVVVPNISKVELAAHTAATELNNAVIQVSNDDVNWTFYGNVYGTSTSSLSSFEGAPVAARYIRIYRSLGGRVSISEARVHHSYNFVWSPSNYLDNNQNPLTYYQQEQRFPPQRNPAVYTLTASMDNCVSRDSVMIEVIRADAGVDGCGPRVIGGTSDDSRLGETFLWEIVSGGGTFTGPTNTATTTVSASPSGQPTVYRLTTSYKGQTCSDLVTVPDCGCLVIADFASNIGCANMREAAYVKLFPSTIIGLGDSLVYSWTPTVGLSAYNTREVYLTDTVDRVYTLKISSFWDSTRHCSDDIRVNNITWNVPVFNAKDTSICSGSVAIGNASIPGYTYQWTPATGLSSATTSNPIASPVTTTEYRVVVTETSTGCFKRDTATVNVKKLNVDAGPDYQVCIDGIIQLGGFPAEPGYSYYWTPSAPWQNGTDSTFAQPEVLVGANLTFVLQVQDSATSCVGIDSMHVTVTGLPALVAAPDVTICRGASSTIGSPAKPGVTYSWAPSTGLNNPNIAQPIANPTVTTTYVVTAAFLGACDSVRDTILVTVNGPVFTLPDINYCPSSGAVALGAAAPSSGITSYSWSPAALVTNATIRNPSTLNPPPSVPTDFVLTVTNSSGCTGSDTMRIIPNGTAPVAGSNRTMCLGSNTQLGSSANATGAGITYAWTPATGLSCTNCPQPIFTPTAAGTFIFRVSKTQSGCTLTDSVMVTVFDYQLPAIVNPTVCQNSCVEIGFTPAQPGVQYSWSPAAGLSSTAVTNPIACVTTSSVSYTLTGVSPQGCVAQKTVAINVTNSAKPVINMADTVTVFSLPAVVQFNPTVTPAGSYNYIWTPNDFSMSNRYTLNPLVTINSAPKSYTLTVTSTTTGCESAKHVTVILDAPILPVTLVSFDAELMADRVYLDWKTASELNNDYFEVERSADASDWEKIGEVTGNGTTSTPHSYQYVDRNPLSGISYYRLRQVDFNGQFEYSPVRSVEYAKVSTPSKVIWYPNPSNGTITIKSAEGVKEVVLTDMLGRHVVSVPLISEDTQQISLGYVAKGTYLIRFIGENIMQTDKMIIQ